MRHRAAPQSMATLTLALLLGAASGAAGLATVSLETATSIAWNLSLPLSANPLVASWGSLVLNPNGQGYKNSAGALAEVLQAYLCCRLLVALWPTFACAAKPPFSLAVGRAPL